MLVQQTPYLGKVKAERPALKRYWMPIISAWIRRMSAAGLRLSAERVGYRFEVCGLWFGEAGVAVWRHHKKRCLFSVGGFADGEQVVRIFYWLGCLFRWMLLVVSLVWVGWFSVASPKVRPGVGAGYFLCRVDWGAVKVLG